MDTSISFEKIILVRMTPPKKLSVLLIFFLLTTVSLFSQTFLINVNAPLNQYPITFTDFAQQKLILTFTKNVTPGLNISQVGWSVTGTAASILQIDAAGNIVQITLNDSIKFAERLNVKVTYNAGTGNFLMADGTEPLTLTNISAVNNSFPTQADFSNGLYGELPPVDICAAVLNVEVTSNLLIEHRYRNSIYFRIPRMSTLWMYPAAVPKTEPDYIEFGGVGSGKFAKTNSYAAYPDNTSNCTWIISIFPYIPPQAPAPGLSVTDRQVFITIPNYKKDNGTPIPGTGDLGLDPPVDDPRTLFCVGEDISDFTFTDATVFDCQLPVEPNLPNTRPRNVQYVYGTHTGAGIPNVFILVGTTMVQVTDNTGAGIQGVWHVDPDGTANVSGYTTPSGYFEGPVVQYNWDSGTKLMITPMITTYPIYHAGDYLTDAENDIFDVTLRNWGPCNPYDGADPFNYLQAVTDFSRLRLVGAPPLPTAPDKTVCYSIAVGVNTLNAVRNGANPGMLHWYDNADLLPAHEVGTGPTFDPGTLAPNVYNYWVREIGTSGMKCEGPAKQVILTINDIPNQPTISRNNPDFCFNGTSSIILTANPHTPPAISSYQWYRNGTAVSGATGSTITLNTVAQSGDYTVRTYGVASTNCPSPLSAVTTVLIGQPATVNAGPATATICSSQAYTTSGTFGGGATSVTWTTSGDGIFGNVSNAVTTYTPGTSDISSGSVTLTLTTNDPNGPCPAVSDFLTLSVVKAPSAYAGADVAICQGSIYTVNDATASDYNTLNWTENGSGSITAGQGTLTPTYTPAAGDIGLTRTLTLTATGNGGCAQVVDSKWLYIDRTPTATVGPRQDICNSTTANLVGNASGNDLNSIAYGEWTFINNLIWQETFSESPDFSTSGTQWTTSGITPDADTWFRTEGRRMNGQDLDAEAVWRSNVIDISGHPSVAASVYLQETGNLSGSDYIKVYYKLNGGGETYFTTNGNNVNDFTSRTASVTGLTGNTLQIVIRARNDNPGKDYFFDNLEVREVAAVTEPVITDRHIVSSAVSGLWQGDNRFRWSVFSQHNGCDSVSAVYIIRRDVPPAAANAGSAQTFCETDNTVMAANSATNGGTGTWSLISGSGVTTQVNNPLSPVTGLGYGPNVFRWTMSSALGICANTTSNVTITRNPDPLDLNGNVTIVTNPVCYNTPGQLRITGTEANVTYYLRTGGVDGNSVHGNGGTRTLTTPNLTSSTTYQIHAVKDVTGCDIIFGSYTINVNPQFTLAQLQSSHNICALATTTISIALTGGTGPYDIVWNDGSAHAINNYVSGTNITVGPYPAGNTNISLTSVVDNNNCTPASLGTPITITVGSTPTSATLTGSADICVGGTSNLAVNIANGVSPYTVIIDNGVGTWNLYTSGSTINLPLLPVGAHIYHLTSVKDACGNFVPGVPPLSTYTINVNAIPSAAGTINNTASICNNGATDIVLHADVASSDFIWTVTNAPAVTWVAGKAPVGGTRIAGDGTSIAQNLSHTATFPTTVTYTITPRGPGGTACLGNPVTRDVIVKPTPVLSTTLTPAAICSNTSFSYAPASATAGTTFNWSRALVAGISNAAASGTDNPNETLVNTTANAINVTYVYTLAANGCSNVQNVVVSVKPTPVLSTTLTPAAICSNTSFSYAPASATAGTTFNWSRALVAGISNAAASGTDNPNETLVNTTANAINVTYVYTLAANGCSNVQNVVVSVKPTPVLSTTLTPAAICSNTSFSYAPASATAGTTFNWSRALVAGISNAAASGTDNPNETLVNTTANAINVTYVYTLAANGCSNVQNVVVSVKPTPVLSTTLTPAAICSNTSFSYAPASATAGTTFNWSRALVAGISNAAASGTDNPNETLVNTTANAINVTYVYTLAANGCSNVQNVVVSVKPTPVLSTTLTPAAICSNTSFSYAPASATAGTTFNWSRALVAGISNAAASGTDNPNETLVNTTANAINVTYVYTLAANGCSNVQNVVVSVKPTPVLSTTLTPAAICSNTSFSYAPASATAGTTFNWSRALVAGISNAAASGTDNPNETLVNTTANAINVTYVYTLAANGCSNVQNVVVSVKPTPVLSTTLTPAAICSNTSFSYAPASATAGTTFNWSRALVAGISNAAASGTDNPNETLVNTTANAINVTYVYTLAANGCSNVQNVVVSVKPTPVLSTTLTPAAICSNTSFSYAPASATAGTTFNWSRALVAGISNAAASGTDNPNETLVNTTANAINVTYVYTLAANGCSNVQNVVVSVKPSPVLSTVLNFGDICSNSQFSYPPASATAGTTFDWSRAVVAGISPVGPTSGTNNPNETLRNITGAPIVVTYQYTLEANGCSNVQDVTVNVRPEPVITPDQSVTACSGNPVNYPIVMDNFTNPASGVTFIWLAPVLNPVNPGFTGGTARVIATSANITDTFINTTGSVGTATYTVTPYKDGCPGTPEIVVISVGSQPVLDPGLNRFACSNEAIGLVLKEAAGSVLPTHYNILAKTVAFGMTESGNAAIPNIAPAPAGYLTNDKYVNTTGVNKTVTYSVQPVFAPDCFGTPVDVVVTIRPQPLIFPAQTKTVCSGVAIGKEILLSPANTPANSLFNWPVPVISDGSIQGTEGVNVDADAAVHINDQIYNYSGAPVTATYNITPVSEFGCTGNMMPVIITINPEPVPQPISGRDKICVTDKNVLYIVNPVSNSTFTWTVDPAVGVKTFDFNTNAIMINAAAAAGSGNISVFETNSYTCAGDPFSLPVQVYTQAASEDINGPAVVCTASTHTYSVTNRAGSIYNWTVPGGAAIIGDPSASSITILFANVGGTILVRETNAAGCITNHNPLAVTVNPLPTATISGGGTICEGGSRNLSVDFTGTGPYTFTYALNGVPQLPVATAADPYILNVTAAGTYTIVNVSDANCDNTGTGTTTVTYFTKPTGTISGTTEMCRGGSATLTMTFTGTAPFTFTYTDGTTPVTVNGHLTNVYTVSVSPLVNTSYSLTLLTDGNSCIGALSGTADITVNLPPSLTLNGTNLICNNINTGAVDMSITGGTAPFGISWTGPDGFNASSEDISGLKAGYYAVIVTDTKGCTAAANITLTQPPVLTGSAAGTNITCFGTSDGTITISGAAGGTGIQEFTIDGGGNWQVSPIFTGLSFGTYNVMMRDAANPTCILVLNNALQITAPDILNATVTGTDVNCFGADNGSVIISSPSGGYGAYGYSIDGGSNWQGSGNFTNLPPDTYDVRIRDAAHAGCEVILNGNLVISEPPVLAAIVSSTNVSCFGSTDGTINISGESGGHGTYQYSINGGGSWQATGTYTGLAPGTYNVQIRDAAFTGCYKVINAALVISQPAVLQAIVSSSNVTCNGAADGIINITSPLGGYGTYQFSINGGTDWQIAGLFNNLAPGTYDVRIRDAANTGCFIILNAGLQITEPAALSAMVVKTDITCFGAGDGVISITNSAGGYGTYQYTIDGGINWLNSATFSALLPGSYDVRIRDKVQTGCILIIDNALVISQPDVLSATVSSTNVTCNGAADGTITISGAAGGYGSYSYSINGGTSWQGSGIFTNLAPGTYNIRIRDAVNTGCIIALNPPVVITEPVILSGTIVKTNVTCYGAGDGTITINGAAGGYGTYEYTINGGTDWQVSNIFSGLIPGFYNVKIRDAGNPSCIITLNNSLNVSEPIILNANIAKTNVTCNGADNGTITISSPSGGHGTYEYSVDGGTVWQGSGSFTLLAPGSYNVLIRDAAVPACIITLNGALVITEPDPLTATVTPTEVTCFGANNGIITITGATGGYGTYEYSVNGGTNWTGLGNFANLSPGTYDVRIRDAAHAACVVTLNGNLVISQPSILAATVDRTNISCFGASDGSITITGETGGYGNYEFSINGGGSWQGSGSFTALGPGNYNVQIRDADHISCVIVLNNALQITQPPVLNAVVTPTNVTCNGAGDGIINITAPVGGYGTYQYSVDGGLNWQVTGLFSSLLPATYDVRIRDAANNGCVIVLNNALNITEPALLNANVSSANVTCFGANNGTITITSPTGGYGTYEYSKNGGGTWQSSGNFTNLIPGTYNVQIRDKAHIGCFAVLDASLEITEPDVLSADVASTNVTCFGAGNGTITITNPLGGYGTYAYTVNGGATWQASGIFTGLNQGSYNVRIRDAANTVCEIVLDPALIITQPAILSASVASTNVTCNGANDGTITITNPLGGYGSYEYSVNGGTSWQPSGSFAGLTPGFYNVQIRDAGFIGCVITLNSSLRITEPPVLSANLVSTNITCNSANDGTITISSPTGGYGTYEYSADGGSTWQSSGSFTALTPGSYNVQMHDAAHPGCVIVLNGALLITEPAPLSATVTPTMVTCFGSNNGIITITGATGGYGTYQYSVDGGSSWAGIGNFTNLAPASYDVRIRDAANPACEVILDGALIITQPAILSATVSSNNVSCFGGSDGAITISAPSGGYGTYGYSINGGGSWQPNGNFTALVPGNYNVQIRDAAHAGCVIVLNASLPITQPAALNAIVTPANVTCNGVGDGIINITSPTGGSGAYGYSVDGGVTWQPSGLFNGLLPGTYNVQIRDAANIACIIILNSSVTITEPAVLNAAVSSVNVSCFGSNDGSISITFPTGGYGTYEFSVDGGSNWQSSGSFTNLAPASYNVQIRDKAHIGCEIVLNSALVITQPAVLSATVSSSDVTCFGANNGTITITNPQGGYGTYNYSVNGGSTWQPSGTFTNLAPGTYNVMIRDAGNIACSIILDGALLITQPAILSASVASSNVTCYGAGDGTITITNPLGGYGTYEYTVNGGTSWHSSGNFTALLPGFYNVQIRDAGNISCVIILNGSLQITQPSVLAAFVSKTNVTCYGTGDGTITIVGASGGYGTFEYSINGGTVWQSSGSFVNLLPGSYNVQLRDGAHTGCVMVLDPALVITQPAVLSATVTPDMVTCFGANDGKITISSPAGGYGAYQYSVNGGTTWQGSGTFTNLTPATYSVWIRDAGNISCSVLLDGALAITQPSVLNAVITSTNVSCFGGNDGTITISSPTGGYGTYEYSINGGGSWQSSGSFTGLTPGGYSVLIRDGNHTGCVIVLNSSYSITQPGPLTATVTKTDVTCFGANDGSITISSPSGGYGTYQYSVDGGSSWVGSSVFVNLLPATYDVRIRDGANQACSTILYPNLVITEPFKLALTSTGDIALDCFSDMDGIGTFYGSGGTMPYNFIVVSNTTGATMAPAGFNSQTFFNAGAGVITMALTDFNGCFATATVNITQPLMLTPGSIGTNQILCSGDNPLQLTETGPATGGPGGYNYQWQYSSNAGGPFINIANATGTIYLPPAGATNTLFYRRMVSSGICMPVYSNVVEVRVNPRPVAVLSGGETICPSQTSVLKVTMMSGTGPFEVDIENLGTITGYVSGTDIVVSPASTTIYKLLRVRDANNCEVLSPSANLLGSATVTVRDLPLITVPPADKTTCEFGLVNFTVTATGTDLTYQWFVDEGSGFNPVTDGGIYFGATNTTLSLFGATRLMDGFIYHAVVTGCSSSVTSADAILTVNTVPEIVIQPKDSVVCLNANATFSVTATGTNITYLWQVNKGTGFNAVVDDANFSGYDQSTLTITNAPAAFNNYIFRVIVSGACGIPVYSNFAVLRVNIPPAVTLNPVSKSICDGGGPVIFTANGSGMIDSLRWQVFNSGAWSDIHDDAIYGGATSQQLTLFNVPYAFNGNQYRLSLKAKCSIVPSNAATLTVNANPVVDFSGVDPIHACGGIPLVINGNPTGGSGTWSSHLWTGDVGPLNNYFVQSPTFNSQIAATYNLNYRVKDSNGCYGSDDVAVIVDAPDASFSQDISYGCTPLTVNFTKDMTGIANFSWNFDDGSPLETANANPAHIFTNATPASVEYYNVELSVQSPGGCTDTYTSMVTVYPKIDATFTSGTDSVCSGSSVTFSSIPGASRYFWEYGDGVSSYGTATTNHIYTNATTAPLPLQVRLTTTSFYNCVDVETYNIVVMPVPLPMFSALPVTQEYETAGNPVTFTNETNAGTWNWLWQFGDGTTSAVGNPVHTYTTIGDFNVTLLASNEKCSATVVHQIHVTPKRPIAGFDSIPRGCSPLTVQFNNTSLYTDTPGTSYMWEFGDGGISTAKNPEYTYFDAGIFTVKLTVRGPGGESDFSRTVRADPSPKAYFEVAPTFVFVNDEKVRMFNLTQGADAYLWEFGDGDTSKVKEPFHKYMKSGIYDITLWAYNTSTGCSDKYILSPGVTVEPAGEIRFATVFRPNMDGPIEGPPTTATMDQFFYPPIQEKVLNYKLQVFNRLGVLIFESHDINVPWNGYYKGQLCQQGVYVWFVEGKYSNGKPFKKVGDITLLH